jgi:peptidase E
MRLLLTSSGLVNSHMKRAFQELYQEAVSEPHARNQNKCIYIMDAALDPDGHSDDDDSNHNTNKDRMVRYMTHELQALGVAEVQGVELRTLSEGGAIHLLHDAACVYLEQGNTYYLLYQLRRTRLDQALGTFLAPSMTTDQEDPTASIGRGRDRRGSGRGGLLVGASAGSIVAGRTIRTCEWKNWDDPGHGTWWDVRSLPTGLDGLDLMDGSVGKSLFPHHSAQWNGRVKEMMPQHPEGVIILDEEQFYVQGGGMTDKAKAGKVLRGY